MARKTDLPQSPRPAQTSLFSLVGDAAMSVPFGTGDHDLPVGVQLLAPAQQEPTMFRAARALEVAAGGAS